jgi:hypothetical protein
MPCQVGITTRLDKRKDEWEREVVGLRDWRVHGTFTSRQAAQAAEDHYATQYTCNANHGGANATGPWCVYFFRYDRRRP